MAEDMKENTKMTKNRDREPSSGQTVGNMWADGRMASSTGRESISLKMETVRSANGLMANV